MVQPLLALVAVFKGERAYLIEWIEYHLLIGVGHFFLFCNVFRVRRRYELMWTALCLVNFTAWFLLVEPFTWLGVMGVQTPATLLAIGVEMRSPEYHGIFSRRLNPGLDEWLAGEPDTNPLTRNA